MQENYPPPILGGITAYVSNLVEEQARMKHEVSVITTDKGVKYDKNHSFKIIGLSKLHIPFVKLPIPFLSTLVFSIMAWCFLIFFQYDVVNVHDSSIMPFGLKGKVLTLHTTSKSEASHLRKLGMIGIVDIVQYLNFRINSLLEWVNIRNAKRIILTSKTQQNEIINVYDSFFSKTDFILTRLNPNLLMRYETSYHTLTRPPTFSFLYIGRLVRRKRVDYAILGLLFLKKYFKQQIRLIICGTGPQEPYLKYLVNRYKLTEVVSFMGNVTGTMKNDVFKNNNCFFLISSYEGNPISVLEAQIFGIPMILSEECAFYGYNYDKLLITSTFLNVSLASKISYSPSG